MNKLFVRLADRERDQWMSTLAHMLTRVCKHGQGPLDMDAEILGEHLEQALLQSHDSWIDQACLSWPEHAGAIRRQAEQLSERVSVTRHGTRTCLALFAVPLVFEFDDEIPSSQFDAHVLPADSGAAWARWAACAVAHLPKQMGVLSPRIYRLEELRNIPLSAVRQATFALSQGERAGQPASWPANLYYRRRRSYLRFLVGYHRTHHQARAGPSLEFDVAATEHRMSTHVKQALGTAARVKAFFDGSYHDCLYAGMWGYQEIRAREVTAHALRTAREPIEAVIEWYAGEIGHELGLGFNCRHPHVKRRTYVLSSRPGDLPAQSIDRLSQVLQSAGIERIRRIDCVHDTEPRPLNFSKVRLPI